MHGCVGRFEFFDPKVDGGEGDGGVFADGDADELGVGAADGEHALHGDDAVDGAVVEEDIHGGVFERGASDSPKVAGGRFAVVEPIGEDVFCKDALIESAVAEVALLYVCKVYFVEGAVSEAYGVEVFDALLF